MAHNRATARIARGKGAGKSSRDWVVAASRFYFCRAGVIENHLHKFDIGIIGFSYWRTEGMALVVWLHLENAIWLHETWTPCLLPAGLLGALSLRLRTTVLHAVQGWCGRFRSAADHAEMSVVASLANIQSFLCWSFRVVNLSNCQTLHVSF